ncbi:MAG: hypothetical protein IJ366_06990 [Clostridia bacterium]|nr:hypothetical protein [Clostridia bacterium]
MLNLCVFIFIIYAVSYSAKVILFGSKIKKRRQAYRVAAQKPIRQAGPSRKSNVIQINQSKIKTGRKGKRPLRPLIYIPKIEVAIAK